MKSVFPSQITSWNGTELIYENLFESRKGAYGTKLGISGLHYYMQSKLSDQRFARGVTSVDDVVCVGKSRGTFSVLKGLPLY